MAQFRMLRRWTCCIAGARNSGRPSLCAAAPEGAAALRKEKPPVMISIDGNIGSGKSTLLGMLKDRGFEPATPKRTSVHFAPERTHEWKGMLESYYEDTKRWAFSFQMQVLLSHIRNHREARALGTDLCFVERSPLAARWVFGEILKRDGTLTEVEAALFDDYMELAWCPDAIVLLDCSPETCLERVAKRSRTGEAGIPLEYLRSVSQAYEEFVQGYARDKGIPVVRVNTERGEIASIYQDVAGEIQELLEMLL